MELRFHSEALELEQASSLPSLTAPCWKMLVLEVSYYHTREHSPLFRTEFSPLLALTHIPFDLQVPPVSSVHLSFFPQTCDSSEELPPVAEAQASSAVLTSLASYAILFEPLPCVFTIFSVRRASSAPFVALHDEVATPFFAILSSEVRPFSVVLFFVAPISGPGPTFFPLFCRHPFDSLLPRISFQLVACSCRVLFLDSVDSVPVVDAKPAISYSVPSRAAWQIPAYSPPLRAFIP